MNNTQYEYENLKAKLNSKIKTENTMLIIISALSAIVAVIFLIFKSYLFAICFFGVFMFGTYVFLDRLVKVAYGELKYITVVCTEKEKAGYRRQYQVFSFKVQDNDEVFEIKTSQKGKFKKGQRYLMCFASKEDDFKMTYSNLLGSIEQ